jgi:hypothetical protein
VRPGEPIRGRQGQFRHFLHLHHFQYMRLFHLREP